MPINSEKETALLTIIQQYEADFNMALDAVIAIASAAKNKTSIRIIGAKAIINSESEPAPESAPEPAKGKNVG